MAAALCRIAIGTPRSNDRPMSRARFTVSDATLRTLNQSAGAEGEVAAVPVEARCPGDVARRRRRRSGVPSLVAMVRRDVAGRGWVLLRCPACGFEVETGQPVDTSDDER